MLQKPSVFIGDRFETNRSGIATVVAYNNARDCTVQFDDGTIVKTTADSVRKGKVGNPSYPAIYGLGFFGVPDEGRDKKYYPAYSLWHAMMMRCYDTEHPERGKSYKDCHVNPNWYNFQTYRNWYDREHRKGWHMDKDIAYKGNKEYGEGRVFFVPQEINCFAVRNQSTRGAWPLGVSLYRGRFCAQHSVNGKNCLVGTFDNPVDAFYAYKAAKEARAKELAEKYRGQVNEKITEGLLNYSVEIDD